MRAQTSRAALSWGSLSRCTSPSSLRTPWYLKWPVGRENASHDKLLHQIAMPALHVDVGSFLSLDQGVLVLRRCGVPDLLQFSSGAIWRTWWGYPLGFGVVATDRHFACFLLICAANGPSKYQLCVFLRTGCSCPRKGKVRVSICKVKSTCEVSKTHFCSNAVYG